MPKPNIGPAPPDATADTRLASVAQGHQRYPYRRKRRPIPPDWYSVADAAFVLGIDRVNVRRYCETIKGFAIRDGDRGQWWVDPIVLSVVGKIRIANGGKLPHGVMSDTARRDELRRATLTLLHRPDATIEQITALAKRIRRASRDRRPVLQKETHHELETKTAGGSPPPAAKGVFNMQDTCACRLDSATCIDQRKLIATTQPDDRQRRPPRPARAREVGHEAD